MAIHRRRSRPCAEQLVTQVALAYRKRSRSRPCSNELDVNRFSSWVAIATGVGSGARTRGWSLINSCSSPWSRSSTRRWRIWARGAGGYPFRLMSRFELTDDYGEFDVDRWLLASPLLDGAVLYESRRLVHVPHVSSTLLRLAPTIDSSGNGAQG